MSRQTAHPGNDADALNYTLRTNKRRNLSSSQWAAVAVEADALIAEIQAAVEAERRAKIAEARTAETAQLIEPSLEKNDRSTAHKVAEAFNTNRTYINDAAKLKRAVRWRGFCLTAFRPDTGRTQEKARRMMAG